MLDLYETYEENSNQIGKVEKNRFGTPYALLPVSHIYQTAQVEVSLDFQGNFVSAEIVPKDLGNTIIPSTIDSANRTSGVVPHPLHDKLMYVAGDFVEYGGEIRNNTTPFQDYLKQLKSWCDFDPDNRTIQAVYTYLSQGKLISDLIAEGVLVESQGKLISKWTKAYRDAEPNKPKIFDVLASSADQFSTFIRFSIFDRGSQSIKPWEDLQMFQSFINFYQGKIDEIGLCYITGINEPITNKHDSKIRYGGDQAKIIFENVTSKYTYLGRFSKKEQVATIGYETSKKAHNALKWLITKQAQIIDERVFLTWGKKSVDIPDSMDSLLAQFDIDPIPQNELADTTQSVFAKQFRQAIAGYKNDLATNEQVYILILDSATKGRMAITYYQKFNADIYLEKIKKWHETCSWRHAYKRDENKKMTFYYGAPTNRDIALAAYGSKASDQIIKNTMTRLLPSIVEGRLVPRDIVQLLINQSSSPLSKEEWEWERTLSITCSMIKKYYQQRNGEIIDMALNKESTDRNYLFGRMLAVADVLEKSALAKQNEQRMTNAKRYMTAFSQHPMSTWKIIRENLLPYQTRLGGVNVYYEKILGEIAELFDEADFNDQSLNGKYLLGYDSQRQDIYTKNKKIEEQA